MSQQRPPRMSFYLDEETKRSLDEIKQHYGVTSPSTAVRRAIVEHAKSLKEPAPKPIVPIRYSNRVF